MRTHKFLNEENENLPYLEKLKLKRQKIETIINKLENGWTKYDKSRLPYYREQLEMINEAINKKKA